ncbi:hypothetical protein PZ938_14065 [Luteipulveratus sp. YIM 133132]|uniref:Lipoprotein n=1 Tax=Luteipulveratus flavus TaxID=3031728 RepID=A0ABT6C5P3_9MICO|nr:MULTISPECIES: hypothetical protein [unclassified Luteipulveratus]MDE9366735.1 hypothetical protein [Luteipulveratus sp. YIM 133132]MDF8264215.1 hypothetical protein [Luteipulveratus sp. YIM 133296]
MRHVTRSRAATTLAAVLVLTLGACKDEGPSVSAPTAPASVPSASTSSAPEASTSSTSPAGPTSSSGSSAPSASSSGTPAGTSASAVVAASRTSSLGATSASVRTVVPKKSQDISTRGRLDGSNQEVTVQTSAKGRATVRRVGTASWVKGDDRFWSGVQASPSDRKAALGRWLPLGGEQSDQGITGTSLLTEYWDAVADLPLAQGTVAATTYAGRPALQVSVGSGFMLTVTPDPKHLPLQSRTTEQTYTFSEWDAVPGYSPPPSTQLVPAAAARNLSRSLG